MIRHWIHAVGYSLLGAQPLEIFLVALVLWLVIFAAFGKEIRCGKLAMFAGGLIILGYISQVIWYCTSIVLSDHLDPTFIATSVLWGRGQPIYHPVDFPWRYSMVYGPAPYIIESWWLKAVGMTIHASRIPPMLAAIGAVASLLLALKKEFNWKLALIGCATCILGFSYFDDSSYWTRVDPFLTCFVCIGLLASRIKNAGISSVLCGIALGLSINVKVHGGLCFLPLLAMMWMDGGWKKVLPAILIGGIVTILPFIALPEISLSNYLAWIKLAGKHRMFAVPMSMLLNWTIMIALPAIIAAIAFWISEPNHFGLWIRKFALVILGLAIATGLTVIAASKEGAGPHHLMPLAPIFAYLFCKLVKDQPAPKWRAGIAAMTCAYATVAILVAFTAQSRMFRFIILKLPSAEAALAEIKQAEADHPSVGIAVGYSQSDYYSTYYRVQLVLDGNPYPLDAAAIMDMDESGLEISSPTIAAMELVPVWLVPTSEDPWSLKSYYPPEKVIFSEQFREAFAAQFHRESRGRVFDVWVRN